MKPGDVYRNPRGRKSEVVRLDGDRVILRDCATGNVCTGRCALMVPENGWELVSPRDPSTAPIPTSPPKAGS